MLVKLPPGWTCQDFGRVGHGFFVPRETLPYLDRKLDGRKLGGLLIFRHIYNFFVKLDSNRFVKKEKPWHLAF